MCSGYRLSAATLSLSQTLFAFFLLTNIHLPFTTACGAGSFIAAHKGGLIASGAVVAHKVDIGKHIITATGDDFYKVNPKGNVPALVLEDKTLLNEGAATLQWIADNSAPGSDLAPANGTSGRYVLINTLNYLASEVHASYGPLFGPGTDEFKAAQRTKLATKFTYVSDQLLGDNTYLGGDKFTVADCYMYVMCGWAGYVGFDIAAFPKIVAYQQRIAALDFVKEAHAVMNAAA